MSSYAFFGLNKGFDNILTNYIFLIFLGSLFALIIVFIMSIEIFLKNPLKAFKNVSRKFLAVSGIFYLISTFVAIFYKLDSYIFFWLLILILSYISSYLIFWIYDKTRKTKKK
jgi:hypothetical protein